MDPANPSQNLDELAARFSKCFPSAIRTTSGRRTIGREAEYPVVAADGTAGDVQRLLKRMHAQQKGKLEMVMDSSNGDDKRVSSVKNEHIDFTIEVGTGTVEMIHEPLDDLHALDAAHLGGLEMLYAAADAEDMRILGCGIQPITPPSMELMTARQRYYFLHELMSYGWRLFSATSSDQVKGCGLCPPLSWGI